MCFFGDNPESVGVRHTYNTAHVFSHFCLPALIAVSSRTSKRAFTTQSSSQDTSFSLLFIQTHLLPSVQYFNKSECCGTWPGSLGSTGKKKTKTNNNNNLSQTQSRLESQFTLIIICSFHINPNKSVCSYTQALTSFPPQGKQDKEGLFE